MNLPLLNDNLGGFSNPCGVIPRPLEELFVTGSRHCWLKYGLTEVDREKIFNDSLSAGRKLVGPHDYLYLDGFASLLSQNSYCATLRI